VTPHCSVELAPGKYSLQVKHDGYEPHDQTIEVAANGARSFSVSLVEIPQPRPKGEENPKPELESRLALRGLTGGSEAFVDGKSIGRIGHIGEFSANVTPGQHSVKVVTKSENSIIVVRNFGAGRTVTLGKDDLFPTSPPSPEEKDWQRVLGSVPPTIEAVEQFLRRYPSGTHRAEAEAKREQLYWQIAQGSGSADDLEKYIRVYPESPHTSEATAKIEELDWQRARDANTVAGFNNYLTGHRNGKHATLAAQEIDKLEFRSIENANDPARLEDYLSKHPSGQNHDRIYSRLDIVTWEGTNKQELAALRSYLSRFPNGRYVGDANRAITGLTAESKDLEAIKTAIERYRDAYESESPGDMSKAWPTISKEQLKTITGLFNRFSAIKLRIECQDSDIHIGKQQASATCRQNARYTLRGKVQPELPSKVNLELKNLGNEVWVIESVSSQ
jgi:outer membrane protein assembly factor BamD (BamD/ComL family)